MSEMPGDGGAADRLCAAIVDRLTFGGNIIESSSISPCSRSA
jgi:hypothetical protein